MNRIIPLTLFAALAGSAFAQDGTVDPGARIIAALELPHAANEARRAGVGDDQIKIVLSIGKDKKAENAEVAKALRAGAEATKQNGPIDNFGAFVQSQLDAGLRGQDLAAAIRAEHEARGKGKGQGGPPEGKGPEGKGPEGKGPDGVGHEGKGVGAPPPGMGKGGPPPGAGKGSPDGAKIPGGGKGAKAGGGQGGGGQGGGAPKGAGGAPEASKGGGRK